MASSSSIIRALSPSLANIALNTAGSHDDALNARHFALSGANSVDELIELIPSDYRLVLTDPLREIERHTYKLCSARATLAKWTHHASVGTLPPHLRGSAPRIQFSSGYKDADEAKARQAALDTADAEYRVKQLKESILAKTDEVTFMQLALSPQRLWSDLASHIVPRSVTVIAGSKLPVLATAADGTQSVSAWENSPTAIKIRDDLLQDCAVFALRVVSLVEARDAALSRKIEKKRAVAAAATTAAADTEMVVDGVTPNTIASIVRKEVKSVFLGLIAQDKGKRGKGGKLMEITKVRSDNHDRYATISDFFTERSLESHGQVPGRTQEVRPLPTLSPSPLTRSQASPRRRRDGSETEEKNGQERERPVVQAGSSSRRRSSSSRSRSPRAQRQKERRGLSNP
ncbi:hypothetical protein EDB92DRAFT_1811931 [Lactarius akahatsu]|uniref:Uncharacterized protein n=1 Tax=Lactarius akahatsu TaxID=416441 RepID=A0AAD4Q782_9AGAM|nr:hypothetical protein EDB92DRAFT_1811931 [Lactarius akahatsu]